MVAIPENCEWSKRTLCDGVVDWNKDGKILTRGQKQHYEKNGYLLIKNCISQEDIEMYKKRFQEVTTAPKGTFPNILIMKDISFAKDCTSNEQNINKIQDFYNDPVLFSYCNNSTIVDALKDLIGTPSSNLVAFHTMLINKCPDNGKLSSRHPLHQDSQPCPIQPYDFVACAWTAMQKINRENGCLSVIPGTHKGPVLSHSYPKWEGGVNKLFLGITDFDPAVPLTHLEMEAGDTVIFHPSLIHGSGANRTKGFRKSISCHYFNADYAKIIPSEQTTPEKVATEFVGMYKDRVIKQGFDQSLKIDLTEIVRFRCRPVSGTHTKL